MVTKKYAPVKREKERCSGSFHLAKSMNLTMRKCWFGKVVTSKRTKEYKGEEQKDAHK